MRPCREVDALSLRTLCTILMYVTHYYRCSSFFAKYPGSWERARRGATLNYLDNVGLAKNALELLPADSETTVDTLHRNQSLLFLTTHYTCTHYYVLAHYYK